MLSKVLTTPIDDLVEIVRKKTQCSITQLSKELNAPKESVEKWLVVLEEFKILSVNYRGFEGYVTLSVQEKKGDSKKYDIVDNIKELYIDKAKEKKLSYLQMRSLWPYFINEHKDELKDLFIDKAKSLGFDQSRIDKAWGKYEEGLKTL